MNKLTVEQIEKILLDTGVVYVNYGELDERILGPCSGGNTFEVEQEIKEIEVNGLKGKTKGLRRKVREDAKLTVSVVDLSLENIKMSLPGSILIENKLTNGWKIKSTDYIKNITLIGEEMGGGFKVITIHNALIDEGLEIKLDDKDESVMQLVFSAHYDPEDIENNLWSIEDVTELAD